MISFKARHVTCINYILNESRLQIDHIENNTDDALFFLGLFFSLLEIFLKWRKWSIFSPIKMILIVNVNQLLSSKFSDKGKSQFDIPTVLHIN